MHIATQRIGTVEHGRSVRHSLLTVATCLPLLLAGCTIAQAQKPTVDAKDYGKWEKPGRSSVLSPDGKWFAYGIVRVNGDAELRLRDVDAKSPRVIPWGQSPAFSDDGRWVAWRRGVSDEEKKRLEKKKKPARNGASLLELGTGEERTFKEITRFRFDETGRFLALLGYTAKEPGGRGASLLVVDVAAGTELSLGDVTDFAWSDVASLLALTVGTGKDSGNAVQLFDAATGRLRSLDSSGSSYRGLVWRKDSDDLAAQRSVAMAGKKGTAHTVLAWRGLSSAEDKRFELAPDRVEGHEVVQHGGLRWSDDGRMVSLGLRPKKDAPEDDAKKPDRDAKKPDDKPAESEEESAGTDNKKDEPELPGFQLWHSSDVLIFPQQKSAISRDKRKTLLAVWHLDGDRVIKIGSDLDERCELIGDWQYAIERVSAPYPWGKMFGRRYHDLYAITVASGDRVKVRDRVRHSWGSTGGRYVLWFDGKSYWTHDLQTGKKVEITRGIATDFANTFYDTPTDLLPPHGVGGWLRDDAAVLLHDRFDVWRVAPDGGGGDRLTRGAKDEVVHRLVDLDREEPAIDADQPLYFSLRGEKSEKRGYARRNPQQGVPDRLLLVDKMISALQKAKKKDVYLYRAEARDDSPDFFVAGPDLSAPRQISNTNPFQGDYAWTRAELVDFKSEAGLDLQATLLYPANHDPARRYPMIVYTYEILAPQIHRYQAPDERSYYNFTAWTQHGYFVLMPDIVYRPREPGVCAIEAVRPAVKTIVDKGLVDAKKVGIIGHSWGGYQAAYLPTRIDIFAASVAGAPLTNFVSFMGQIHWRSGMPEVSHWETGQGRMEVPFWEDPEAHRRNSPIHKVHEMKTPMLMVFGDDDGTVDWDQGTEFYNFARRAGKHMVLLVYEGERHGFRKKPNQVDYHRRILEWFGHYLKGEPAPKWITDGIPAKDQEKEGRRVAGAK